MARYLITGIAGFIGSTLAHTLVEQEQQVRGIDNLSTGNLDNLADIRTPSTSTDGSPGRRRHQSPPARESTTSSIRAPSPPCRDRSRTPSPRTSPTSTAL